MNTQNNFQAALNNILEKGARAQNIEDFSIVINELNQLKTSYTAAEEQKAIDSDLAPAYSNRGATYHRLNKYEEAFADFNQALKLDPNLAPAYIGRGDVYRRLNKYEEAFADLNQALKLDPNLAPAYAARGFAYLGLNKYETAIADFNQALKLDPNLVPAYAARGTAYNCLNKYEEAIADFNQALNLDPNLAPTYAKRGTAYNRLNKHEAAIADFNQALKVDPNFAPAYAGRGVTYDSLNKHEAAIASFNQALKFDPNLAFAYVGRGDVYRRLNKYEAAITDFNQALKLDPDLAPAYAARGTAYNSLNKYETAIADLNKALKLDPNLASAYTERGAAYYGLNKYEAAIADFTEALKLDPNLAPVYVARGLIYLVLGLNQKASKNFNGVIENFKKALESFNKAITLDKKMTDIYCLRGHILTEIAIGIITKTLSINEPIKAGNKDCSTADDFFTQAFLDFKADHKSETFRSLLSQNIIEQIVFWHKAIKPDGTLDDAAIIELFKLYCAVLEIKAEHKVDAQYLAHYTSLDKLHQLLAKDAKFRLYSVANMNDPNEGQTLIKKTELKKFYKNKNIPNENVPYAFIASFVKEKNIKKESHNALLLWRSYGEDTKGAKFINPKEVFNTEHSASSVEFPNFLQNQRDTKSTLKKLPPIYKVIYKDIDTETWEKCKQLLESALESLKSYTPDEELKAAVRFIIDDIRYLYKSAEYSFEKEYRMVFVAKDIDSSLIKEDLAKKPLTFYLEIDKQDFLFSAGSAIWIGTGVPRKKQEQQAVKAQLKRLRKTDCNVYTSKIDYIPKN